MDYERVKLDFRDNIAVITLNHPEVLNAISAQMLSELKNAAGQIEKPDGGATYLLPRLIGLARSMELSLLAERLPAEKALEWGLINRVYDDDKLLPEALNFAKDLAAGPTVSLSLIRKAYWQGLDNTYEKQLHLEGILQRQAGQTEDFREGVEAFRQKRKALFKGK